MRALVITPENDFLVNPGAWIRCLLDFLRSR